MPFTLRIPFRMDPSHTLAGGICAGGRIRLAPGNRWHVLEAVGLGDEEAAHSMLDKLGVALLLAAVDLGFGVSMDLDLQPLHLVDAEVAPNSPVSDAQVVGVEGRPAIYPDGSRLGLLEAIPPSIQMDVSPERFCASLEEALDLPLVSALPDQYRLAAEVFAASFFEDSAYAAFLSRVAVLEVLKVQADHPDPVRQLVASWQAQVRDLAGTGQLDEDLANSIHGSMEWLKIQSIRRSIRDLVVATLGPQASDAAVALYDLRSDVVHNGRRADEIPKRLGELTELVRGVLRTLMARYPAG